MADRVGFEPTHDFHRLLRFQRNLLNHLSTYPCLESAIGFEPMMRELQSLALPLGYTLIWLGFSFCANPRNHCLFHHWEPF